MSQLGRAASILRALEDHPEGRMAADVALDVGLPRSTAHRLLQNLVAEDLVVQVVDGRRYRLGPTLIRLGVTTQAWLADRLRPLVTEMSLTASETVDVSIQTGDRALFIDQVVAAGRLQAVSQIGGSFPLHCCASGKALLAQFGNDDVRSIVRDELERFTENTITTIDDLLRDLDTVRATGIAYDRDEHTIGISAVAAAVLNSTGLPVALAFPVPSSRFVEREAMLVDMLGDGVERARSILG
ncbi:MAG: IclR family transcriptional regulator [Acidimicrobiales bacterium]